MNLGYLLTVLATVSTAVAMLAYLPGVRRSDGKPRLLLARSAVYLAAASLTAASAVLFYLFLTHQFQYSYVTRYSSTDLPLRYVVSAFWGGQEGTFLLWAFFGGLLAVFLRFKARRYEAPVSFFYLGINLFLLFMLLKASPFSRLSFVPEEGNGLNPLLQDPWMTIHPPIMFFGFAALGIPAAYAMVAMVKRDWDDWVRRSIAWTAFGVIALGTGLVLGGYWSYSILGWGGFWGWDPVENSSLVPWLAAVVLLHTQIIQLKRGRFRRLNLGLAMLPFVLVTYSTFLTRSGVLADFSVHSFTELGINQFLVAFMIVFLAGGTFLFAWSFRHVPSQKTQALFFSREYFLFLGNLIVAFFALVVLLGTSAPILTRLWGPASPVQPEFYDRMGLPFAVLIGLFLGVSPFLFWNRVNLRASARRMLPSVVITVLGAVAVFLAGVRQPGYFILLVASLFAALTNGQLVLGIVRRNWRAAGGYLAHVGIALSIIGILISTAYTEKRIVVLPEGEEVMALGYGFTYLGVRPVEGGRKDAYDVALRTAGGTYVVSPTMFYSDFNRGMMKKPAIRSFLPRDVYVSPVAAMADPLAERIEHGLTLGRDEPVPVMGMDLRLTGVETSAYEAAGAHGHAAHGSGTDYTAVIAVSRGRETFPVRPVLRVFHDGYTETLDAEIPGTGVWVSLQGVDEQGTRVEVGVMPAPLTLGLGESGQAGEYRIALQDFDVEMSRHRGGSVKVFAQVDVTAGGKTYHVKPGLVSRPGEPSAELIEAPLGNTGRNLVMADLDPDAARAGFYVVPAPRQYLQAEISLKPYIVLLWVGSFLTILGLILATAYRAGQAGLAVATVPGSTTAPDRARGAA